jgi:flagellar hook-basal body complex protein FliE
MNYSSYDVTMNLTHPKHMGPLDSPYAGSGKNILALEKTIGAGDVTRGGTFEQAMLQALDKVSDAHKYAEDLAQTAIIDPDAVDAHDVTVAETMASMSFNITSNILNRLVQSWRDIINTR